MRKSSVSSERTMRLQAFRWDLKKLDTLASQEVARESRSSEGLIAIRPLCILTQNTEIFSARPESDLEVRRKRFSNHTQIVP